MRVLSFDIGVKQLAFCDFNYNETEHKPFVINDFNVKDLSIPEKKYDINKIVGVLLDFLSVFNIEHYNYILIENQPAYLNPVMKSIQIIIFTFFIIEKRNHNNNNNISVLFCSASNKLKTLNYIKKEDADNIFNIIKDKCGGEAKKYKFNKLLSNSLMDYFIEHFIFNKDVVIDIYSKNKKKDDLSDCFLQGVSIFNNTRLIK